jgi:hypothetical protein
MTAEDNNLLELRVIGRLRREKGSAKQSHRDAHDGMRLHDPFIGGKATEP